MTTSPAAESPSYGPQGDLGAALILVAGMGADHRQWRPQLEAFPGAVAARWVDFPPGEGLAAYAARLAATLPIGTDTVIAGSSFGGMLALEIARQAKVKPHCVVLLGSCRTRHATNPLLRLFERICRWIPDWVIDRGRWIGVQFLGRGGGITRTDRAMLATMCRELSVGFIRSTGRAIIEWPGCEDPGVPVRHLHGSRDWVIFPWRVRPDEMVPGGAHVLNLSSPERVNAFLRDSMKK